MATIEEPIRGRPTVAQRWLARGAIVAAAASVLVPLLAIGFRASVAVIIVGVVGLGIMGSAFAKNLCAGGWQVAGFDIDAAQRRKASLGGNPSAPVPPDARDVQH